MCHAETQLSHSELGEHSLQCTGYAGVRAEGYIQQHWQGHEVPWLTLPSYGVSVAAGVSDEVAAEALRPPLRTLGGAQGGKNRNNEKAAQRKRGPKKAKAAAARVSICPDLSGHQGVQKLAQKPELAKELNNTEGYRNVAVKAVSADVGYASKKESDAASNSEKEDVASNPHHDESEAESFQSYASEDSPPEVSDSEDYLEDHVIWRGCV